jgi:hypothetical protein
MVAIGGHLSHEQNKIVGEVGAGIWVMSAFTADEEFRISMSNLGTAWAVTIYRMCLPLNLLTIPDLKL